MKYNVEDHFGDKHNDANEIRRVQEEMNSNS